MGDAAKTFVGHPDLGVSHDGGIAIVTIQRPPHNYFDAGLLAGFADHLEAFARNGDVRVVVLAAEGKAFCAGTNHGSGDAHPGVSPVAREALRIFRSDLPVVAAVQGAAIGGGLGLALSADFRVTCREARFWANFSRLGLHAGFGLTVTLPRLVGAQQAARLLYAAPRLDGEEAAAIGLADLLVTQSDVLKAAIDLAREIAEGAPAAVRSMRRSLRRGLAETLEIAMERELLEQTWQRQTEDFKEGVKAMAERRPPVFAGR